MEVKGRDADKFEVWYLDGSGIDLGRNVLILIQDMVKYMLLIRRRRKVQYEMLTTLL